MGIGNCSRSVLQLVRSECGWKGRDMPKKKRYLWPAAGLQASPTVCVYNIGHEGIFRAQCVCGRFAFHPRGESAFAVLIHLIYKYIYTL